MSTCKVITGITLGSALFIIVCTLPFIKGCAPDYSNGERAGTIIKLSYKGLFWKSWEGQMNLGGMREQSDDKGNTSMVPNLFDFNIQDKAILEQVKSSMASGKRVTLTYKQWFLAPCYIQSSSVIVGVSTNY